MMVIQRISLALMVILALGQNGLLSAAESSLQVAKPPILHTMGELKREKTYPADKSKATTFLQGLQKGLQDQVEVMRLNKLKQVFDIDIDNRQKAADLMRAKSPLFAGRTVLGDYRLESEDPEVIALALRYKSLFMRNNKSFDVSGYEMIKKLVAEFKDSTNPHIQELLRIQDNHWDGLYLSFYHQSQILEPLYQVKERFDALKQNPLFFALCRHAKSPLLFYRRANELLQRYGDELGKQQKAGTFTNGIAEIDTVYFKDADALAAEHAAAEPYIATLHKGIERELELVTPKKASGSMSFIDKLPAVRAAQTPTRPQPTKKKKAPQQRTVAPATYRAAEPCSSNDIPQPVAMAPQAVMPFMQQSNMTPNELLVRTAAMVPRSIRPAFNRVEYADGSFTLAEDATRVELFDVPNQQKIKLFKVEQPQKTHLNPNYTSWVQKWFDAPDEALAQQGYNDTTSDRFKYRATARQIHGFTRLVDAYLSQCSTRSTTRNRKQGRTDTLITMPGAMGDKLGLFSFIVDSINGQWYHRNFVERSGKELLDGYATRGYYDVEFPELR